ncbi:MAG: heme ABC exporter ATP-binding protein CcmA [Gammaproteobacteria bacterium]|nr:heme ABC exporter ATP-binding protein CcmA [Gammaproteobacteria bacterium]
MTQHNLQINFLELYRNDDCIFSEISFDLSEGQHLLISGANGTGKTSLLRVICGLTIPTGGTIVWNQLATNNINCRYYEHLAYLGHKNALIPELTARENLEYTFEGNRSMNRTSSVLEAFGLNKYLDQYAEKLSNGQIRKIALSRILLSEKTLWILDEPVANLDTSGTQFLLAEMQAHLDQGGMLITTSNLNDQTLKPNSEINLDKA